MALSFHFPYTVSGNYEDSRIELIRMQILLAMKQLEFRGIQKSDLYLHTNCTKMLTGKLLEHNYSPLKHTGGRMWDYSRYLTLSRLNDRFLEPYCIVDPDIFYTEQQSVFPESVVFDKEIYVRAEEKNGMFPFSNIDSSLRMVNKALEKHGKGKLKISVDSPAHLDLGIIFVPKTSNVLRKKLKRVCDSMFQILDVVEELLSLQDEKRKAVELHHSILVIFQELLVKNKVTFGTLDRYMQHCCAPSGNLVEKMPTRDQIFNDPDEYVRWWNHYMCNRLDLNSKPQFMVRGKLNRRLV